MDTRGYGIRNRPSSILYQVRMGSFAMEKSHVESENGKVGLSGRKPLSTEVAQGCHFYPEQSPGCRPEVKVR